MLMLSLTTTGPLNLHHITVWWIHYNSYPNLNIDLPRFYPSNSTSNVEQKAETSTRCPHSYRPGGFGGPGPECSSPLPRCDSSPRVPACPRRPRAGFWGETGGENKRTQLKERWSTLSTVYNFFLPSDQLTFFLLHNLTFLRVMCLYLCVCVCYLDNRQPHVLGSGEAVQHQQRWRSAAWRPTAGITEAVTSIVWVANHEAEPATPVPAADTSSIKKIIIYYHRKHNVYNSRILVFIIPHSQ